MQHMLRELAEFSFQGSPTFGFPAGNFMMMLLEAMLFPFAPYPTLALSVPVDTRISKLQQIGQTNA